MSSNNASRNVFIGRSAALALVVLAMTTAIPRLARADRIDEKLVSNAPMVLRYIEKRGYKNVGVMAFRLQKGNARPGFRGGTIVHSLPSRLENALIMHLTQGISTLGVAHDASQVAGRKLTRAGYRTASSRRRLFSIGYPLAWGSPTKTVRCDAFFTGKIIVAPDLRSVKVEIECFDRWRPERVVDVTSFSVPMDRYILADVGQGFSLSRSNRAFTRGISEDDIIDSIEEDDFASDDYEDMQALDDDFGDEEFFPVTLRIYYDGKESQLDSDEGSAGSTNYRVTTPDQGQELTIGLENITDEPLGVVLMVNGISTLYEQVGEPGALNKWVLQPSTEYRVKGYHQEDKETYYAIQALSEELSREQLEDLGGSEMAGLIHLYIFRPKYELALEDSPEATRSIRRLSARDRREDAPKDLADLQSVIDPSKFNRALFAWGDQRDESIEERKLGPVELTDTVVIRYYDIAGDGS